MCLSKHHDAPSRHPHQCYRICPQQECASPFPSAMKTSMHLFRASADAMMSFARSLAFLKSPHLDPACEETRRHSVKNVLLPIKPGAFFSSPAVIFARVLFFHLFWRFGQTFFALSSLNLLTGLATEFPSTYSGRPRRRLPRPRRGLTRCGNRLHNRI